MRADRLLRRVRANRGQAAVESALVLPMLVFFILGTLQLTMMQQSRLMLEYAAFNAARAGSVWNMDTDKMETAAVLSLMPTMPSVPLLGSVGRVDSIPALLGQYAVARGINKYSSGIFGKKIINVEILNPTQADFGGKPEIEFDVGGNSLAERRRTQLTVRATYFYELKLPIVNWMMFESWLAGTAGFGLTGFDPGRPKLKKGFAEMEITDAKARWLLESGMAKTACTYNGISKNTLLRLVGVAATGKYYIPLVTTYTIRMQSNPFLKFAPKANATKC